MMPAKKVNGAVGIRLVVDSHGMPRNIKVVKSLGSGLAEEAVRAVQNYRFAPAIDRMTGLPVAFEMHIKVDFRLY